MTLIFYIMLVFVKILFIMKEKRHILKKNKKWHHRFFITLLRRAPKCPNMAKIPKQKF